MKLCVCLGTSSTPPAPVCMILSFTTPVYGHHGNLMPSNLRWKKQSNKETQANVRTIGLTLTAERAELRTSKQQDS
jgi:hypothetical protein